MLWIFPAAMHIDVYGGDLYVGFRLFMSLSISFFIVLKRNDVRYEYHFDPIYSLEMNSFLSTVEDLCQPMVIQRFQR